MNLIPCSISRAAQRAAVAALLILACWPAQAGQLNLAGCWQLALDPCDTGMNSRLWEKPFPGAIHLPGSLPQQGFGDPITLTTPWTGSLLDRAFFTAPDYLRYRQPGRIQVPFWLQPKTYYAGPAWYRRTLEIPAAWRGERVVLSLERPHWETRVWLDGRPMGTNDSLATPHEYELGLLAPGTHTLTIRVDNRRIVDVGENSHSISDHTQGNWNGIVGQLLLRSTPLVWLQDVQVFPHPETRVLTVRGRIGNLGARAGAGAVTLMLNHTSRLGLPVSWTAAGGEFSGALAFTAGCQSWDEFHPVLQTLEVGLGQDRRVIKFGIRQLATQGTQFVLNGRKTFFRGTLECCVFPRTGHPPMEVGSWRRILGVARSCGLNLIRFHSWCPPEAAFEAADEMGFYFQIEINSWANQSTTLGDGRPVDHWLYAEAARILRAYGNHPSFMLMAYGNEPGGDHYAAWLDQWVAHWKAADPRRLYTSASGWPQLAVNDFQVTPDPRIQHWGEGLASSINWLPPETATDYRDYITRRTAPVISHEIGEWCVYPDFDEIPKYTGYLQPKNFEIFRDRLAASGLSSLSRQFLLASGRLQALCYKADIEAALRTPGMGGFELLGLTDFPGQGTALVGVLNPFWQTKGYLTAAQFSRFCNRTVLLARLNKRVFTTDETLTARLEVANFAARPLDPEAAQWELVTDAGTAVAKGKLPPRVVPVDNGIQLGELHVNLHGCAAPVHLRLMATLLRARSANDWGIWVYPAVVAKPSTNIWLTDVFDGAAKAVLRQGGKVLLTLPGRNVRNEGPNPVKLGFSSIFWNTSWTGRQAPTTLGILCDPRHPALAGFPTDFCSDWQWWYLMHEAGALRLDSLPHGLRPIVRVIDDWFTARSLGLVVEARVGRGKIVVCGFDLTGNLAGNPVARQMRASLASYLNSPRCQPATELSLEQIAAWQRVPAARALGGVATPAGRGAAGIWGS